MIQVTILCPKQRLSDYPLLLLGLRPTPLPAMLGCFFQAAECLQDAESARRRVVGAQLLKHFFENTGSLIRRADFPH